jgi:hypothetical protein
MAEPFSDQKNASIKMTSGAIVTTNNTISFDDCESTTVDVKIDEMKHPETHCYREGSGKYQLDYERLLVLTPDSGRANTVRLPSIIDRHVTSHLANTLR